MFEFIQHQLQNNEFLIAIIGGGLLTFVGYQLRGIPNYFLSVYRRKFVWVLKVNDSNPILFKTAAQILFDLFHKNTLNYKLDDTGNLNFNYGTHRKLTKTNFIKLNFELEKSEKQKERKESLELVVHGFFCRRLFDRVINQILESFNKEKERKPRIYKNNSYSLNVLREWGNRRGGVIDDFSVTAPTASKEEFKTLDEDERDFNSVFIEEHKKDLIINEIESFLAKKDVYDKISIPYKKGFIFHGESGTGKTTVAYLIAKKYKRNLCYIDLSNVGADEIGDIFSEIPENSVVVFEDIDCNGISEKRGSKSIGDGIEGQSKGGFLSILLQELDSPLSKSNVIFIATTNHIEKIDPALLRDSRFGVQIKFELADESLAEKMLKFYLEDPALVEKAKSEIEKYPIAQSKIQAIAIKHL